MILNIFILHYMEIRRILSTRCYKRWNKIMFSLKGIEYGDVMNVYKSVYIKKSLDSTITIGSNFTFTSGGAINPLSRNIKGCLVTNSKARIKIGNNVGMSSTCIWAHKSIIIGNNVKIGADVIIMDSDAHSLNFVHRRETKIDQENKKNKEIVIEDDVLIGARCIILKGVHIGARAVIGSGSVVTKDIPADSIAAGNPCQIIRLLQ